MVTKCSLPSALTVRFKRFAHSENYVRPVGIVNFADRFYLCLSRRKRNNRIVLLVVTGCVLCEIKSVSMYYLQ